MCIRDSVKADVDLPLEALAKKAVGNGAQVVDALANAHLNGTAAGGLSLIHI